MFGKGDPTPEDLRARGGKDVRALISRAKAGKTVTSPDAAGAQVIWKLWLRVFPDDRGPYDAVVQVRYPQKAGGPPVGSEIGVVYDPRDRSVAVDPSAPKQSWGTVQGATMNHIVDQGRSMARPGGLVIAGGQVISGGPTTPPAAGSPAPVAEQLEQLADLKARGVLSDAEFEAQKQKLLGA